MSNPLGLPWRHNAVARTIEDCNGRTLTSTISVRPEIIDHIINNSAAQFVADSHLRTVENQQLIIQAHRNGASARALIAEFMAEFSPHEHVKDFAAWLDAKAARSSPPHGDAS